MLPLPHTDVIYKKLPEGGILFHCTDEVYFGLNPAGARVWELLPDAEITHRERMSTLAYGGPKKITKLPKRSAVVCIA